LTGACIALFAAGAWAQTQAPLVQVDTGRLEATEDLSEGLANDLLELSIAVRDRDLGKIAEFFAPSIATSPMPSHPGALTTKVKWISTHGWTVPGAAVSCPQCPQGGQPRNET
jgi:hypothetical protein